MRKILLFTGLVISQLLSAQTADEIKKITSEYNQLKLSSLSAQYRKQAEKDKEYAIKRAGELNIPLIIDDGKTYKELQKILADDTPIYYTTFNVDAARSTRTNHLNIGGSLGLNLMGLNMTAHIWDAGLARITHQEYDGPGGNNRYSVGDGTTTLDPHSAHVAGTIMASGVDPQAKGMAPYAKAVGYDWNYDLNEATTAANNGMLISSHSYGIDSSVLTPSYYQYYFGAYIQDSRSWDNLMFNAPYYLMVNAAGNDGTTTYNSNPLDGVNGYDKLTGHSTSKNSLVVANARDANVNSNGDLISVVIEPSSSQGPTDDYRIKPDIAGNGYRLYSTIDVSNTAYGTMTGTSMATPNVSGTLLLLQEHYNNLNSQFMKAATLKGLVLHTADDAGPAGPDAVWGWGLMNAKRAAETISHKDSQSIINELGINNGQTLTYQVESDGINPLIASISWTDRPGPVNYGNLNDHTPVLINDLDIRVTKGGTTYYPWKLTGVTTNGKGDNNVDPFEKIEIPNASGTYTITITHKGSLTGGNQNFSLIVTGIITSACSRTVTAATGDPVCNSGTSDIVVTGNSGTTQLRLYTVSLGGSPIAVINDDSGTFTTPNVTESTVFYVAAADGSCESARYPVSVIVSTPPPAINVTKVDHSTTGSCDLDYAELTASGGKISNLTIGENDVNASDWALVRNTTNLAATLSNSGLAGGTPNELRILRANTTNQNNSEIYIFPVDIDGEDLSYNISGFTTINFQFKHRFDTAGNGARNIYLGVSTDGANYDLVWSKTNITANINATTVDVDLSAYVGSDNLFFLFRYFGNSAGVLSWYIDDIKITGDKQSLVTWTPVTGLYTDQALTIPYTGDPAMKVYASPDNATNYTANAAWLIGGCPSTDTVEVNPDLSDFLTNTGNWSISSNWSNNAVPDINSCVRIPNGKTLTVNVNNAEAKRLKVDAGGKVIIPYNRALTVDESIENESDAADFVIESGGSLVQNDDYAVNSGAITAKREFKFSDERKQYNFIISPLTGQKIKTIYNNPPYVIYLDETTGYYYNAGDGDYIAGRGLAIKEPSKSSVPSSTIDAVMTGEPFNGILNYPLSYTTTHNNVEHGFNLVGNPYTSNLDIRQLYNDNSSKITSDFLFWDNRNNAIHEQQGTDYGGSNFAVYNAISDYGIAAPTNSGEADKKIPNRYVRPATGFIVRAESTANGQTLDFKNQYRVAANSSSSPQYYGKEFEESPDRYRLVMTISDGLDLMTGVTYFAGGDNDYSADDSDSNNASDDLYTLVDDYQLSIQGKDKFNVDDKIRLGMKLYRAGYVAISVYDKEGVFDDEQEIFIFDRLLKKIHNLETPYKVLMREGEHNNRFLIIYKDSDTKVEQNSIEIKKIDSRFVITSPLLKLDKVEVFNIYGKSVYVKKDLKTNEHSLSSLKFPNQIIVIRAQTEDGNTVNKKFINK